jgi:rSAM/selenodomain-associated transferase 2
MSDAPRPLALGAIIPVLGDTEAARDLVRRLREMPEGPVQIVIVDGGDDPGVHRFCTDQGVDYLATRAGRGHQLHSGALATRAGILWFLHADAVPAREAAICIRHAIAAGAPGGCFRFRFAGQRTWARTALEACINLRARFGVPYGDQGLFMTRDAYLATGGFPDLPLFEEVAVVKALRRSRRFAALPAAIGVSPRRWERDGWIRRSLENRLLALGFMLGAPVEKLARRYQKSDVSPSGEASPP